MVIVDLDGQWSPRVAGQRDTDLVPAACGKGARRLPTPGRQGRPVQERSVGDQQREQYAAGVDPERIRRGRDCDASGGKQPQCAQHQCQRGGQKHAGRAPWVD